MSANKPIAYEAYEKIAEAFDQQIEVKSYNAFYERPAMLSLLPRVRNKTILDAGCGPGKYTEILLKKGAKVIAVDISDKMVKCAVKRNGNRADIRKWDLSKPLTFIADLSIDIIICPLVLEYIKDWTIPFQEFNRILRKGGVFIFSIGNSYHEFIFYKSKNYFKTEKVGCEWKGFGIPVYVPCYRRPLQSVFEYILGAGFLLDKYLEPRPTSKFKSVDPDDYFMLMTKPVFVCIRVIKR
jgi:SAM-dependent methyltransferase